MDRWALELFDCWMFQQVATRMQGVLMCSGFFISLNIFVWSCQLSIKSHGLLLHWLWLIVILSASNTRLTLSVLLYIIATFLQYVSGHCKSAVATFVVNKYIFWLQRYLLSWVIYSIDISMCRCRDAIRCDCVCRVHGIPAVRGVWHIWPGACRRLSRHDTSVVALFRCLVS